MNSSKIIELAEQIIELSEDSMDTKPKKKVKPKYKIVLEVGHGDHPDGFEPGAVDPRTGVREHALNKIVAMSCEKELKRVGFEVIVTDSGDYLGNIGKTFSDCDVFVSIHHNAFSDDRAQGSETLIHDTHWNPDDEKLAKALSKHMSERLAINNRGIKTMSLSILKGAITGAKKPGKAVVLVEPYFITGKDVDDHLTWSKKSGIAIADGILEFLKY